MKIWNFGTRTLTSCMAAALLAGCTFPFALRQAQGDTEPQSRAIAAKHDDLLYISDGKSDDVYVYRLRDLKLTGTLTGFSLPGGECSDSGGNVWIIDSGTSSRIVEYAHGGTSPISILNDPTAYAVACSVDPSSGNLAVTNIFTISGGQGNVAIYKGASGSPAFYQDSSIQYVYFCGYDKDGDLYVDGQSMSGAFVFAELPKGSSTFTNITLNVSITFPGDIQWDGHHVTTTPQQPTSNVIYRLKISGSTGSVIGKTRLQPPSCSLVQVWITGARAASSCLASGASTVKVWRYPGGGNAIKSGTGSDSPAGTTISLAPR